MAEYRIDLTGDYDTTVYDCAYVLMMAGADPGDTVITVRKGTTSMSTTLAAAAPFYVAEDDKQGLQLRRRKCSRFPNGKWGEAGGVKHKATERILAQI